MDRDRTNGVRQNDKCIFRQVFSIRLCAKPASLEAESIVVGALTLNLQGKRGHLSFNFSLSFKNFHEHQLRVGG